MWKGWCWLCVRGELETEIDCHILAPNSSDHSSTSSSFCWAAQPGSWGPKPSVWSWFSLCGHPISNWNSNSNSNCNCNCNCNCNSNWTASPTVAGTDCLKLTQAICGTWLYNCLTRTYFLWAYASAPNSTTSTGQGDILTSRPDAPVSSAYLHRCISWLMAWSRANMLHV